MKYPELLGHDIARVEESRNLNLVVGEIILDVIKTSFGPRGMDKVYIDVLGEDRKSTRLNSSHT